MSRAAKLLVTEGNLLFLHSKLLLLLSGATGTKWKVGALCDTMTSLWLQIHNRCYGITQNSRNFPNFSIADTETSAPGTQLEVRSWHCITLLFYSLQSPLLSRVAKGGGVAVGQGDWGGAAVCDVPFHEQKFS